VGHCGGVKNQSLLTRRPTNRGKDSHTPLQALAEALQVNTTLKILNIKDTALLDASTLYGKTGTIMTDYDDLELGVEMLGDALLNNIYLTSLIYGMNN
jgi:hypothetical protein